MLSPSSKTLSVARLTIEVLIRIGIFSIEGEGPGESPPFSEEHAQIVNRAHVNKIKCLIPSMICLFKLVFTFTAAIQINAMKTCFHNAKCSFSIAKVEKIKVPCKSIMVHTVKTLKIVYEV